jgi:hypothetical protein
MWAFIAPIKVVNESVAPVVVIGVATSAETSGWEEVREGRESAKRRRRRTRGGGKVEERSRRRDRIIGARGRGLVPEARADRPVRGGLPGTLLSCYPSRGD